MASVFYVCNKCSESWIQLSEKCPKCDSYFFETHCDEPIDDDAEFYTQYDSDWPLDRSCSDEHDYE